MLHYIPHFIPKRSNRSLSRHRNSTPRSPLNHLRTVNIPTINHGQPLASIEPFSIPSTRKQTPRPRFQAPSYFQKPTLSPPKLPVPVLQTSKTHQTQLTMCQHNVHSLTCMSCGVEYETWVREKPCKAQLARKPNPFLYDVMDGFRKVDRRNWAMEEQGEGHVCSDLVIVGIEWDGVCETCRKFPRADCKL